MQIEIKQSVDQQRYPGIEAKVLEAIRHYGMLPSILVLSFDFPTLQGITALQPRVATCALIASAYLSRFEVRRDPGPMVDDLVAHGFRCVGIKHTWLTEPLFRALRQRDFRVGVWTVNDAFSMRKFAEMGVDFITADRPDVLRDIGQ